MAVITIDTLISKVDNEIIRLEKLNSINVTVRIDDTVDFLKDVLFDTKAIKGDQKFDLVETIGENCTAVYELNGNVITAGSNVLTFGDELTITITADTGYTINAFTINDVSYTLGDTVEETLTVVDNLEVVASAELKTFNLVTTPDANCLITVTKDEAPIVAGTDVISYDDVLVITATANEDYEILTLQVNSVDFTSGEEHEVVGDVVITATSQLI